MFDLCFLEVASTHGCSSVYSTDLHYAAPEVISCCAMPCCPNESYGTASDVWSLGVLMYTLISGYEPFMHHSKVCNRHFNALQEPVLRVLAIKVRTSVCFTPDSSHRFTCSFSPRSAHAHTYIYMYMYIYMYICTHSHTPINLLLGASLCCLWSRGSAVRIYDC